MKRNVIILTYWVTTLFLFAVVLCSTGYTMPDALFFATSLMPVTVLLRFFLARIRFDSRHGLWELLCLVLSTLTFAFLIVHLAHTAILYIHHQMPTTELAVPPMLLNPVFLLSMLLLLVVGDYYLSQFVDRYIPEEEDAIIFVSDRQSITLLRQEILYVESCDTETWIHATDGRRYRNKRPISAWANLLGRDFLRIHRSYLVRLSACQGREGDNVVLGNTLLPISRKYRAEVQEILEIIS